MGSIDDHLTELSIRYLGTSDLLIPISEVIDMLLDIRLHDVKVQDIGYVVDGDQMALYFNKPQNVG
jgi:hypothetical protein